MAESKYDIIFRGDVVAGANIVDVKQRLAQLFKIDLAKVDALFTGRAVPLKRNVDLQTAEKYKTILLKAGAQVSVKDISKAESVKAPKNPNVPISQESDNAITSSSGQNSTGQNSTGLNSTRHQKPQTTAEKKPLTLKERLAKAAEEEEMLAKKKQQDAEAKKKQEARHDSAQEGFVLAPVGSILGDAEQRGLAEAAEVDVSHLSASPPDGDLLSPDEKKPDVVVDIDVSDMDIAEIGADLIAASERMSMDAKPITVGDYGVADVGADLLSETEKPPAPKAPISDVEFDLAPVGSDIGQIKKPAPPSPPDTSSLSLSEP
ncbi:MAG: hypothetical protein ACRBCS_06980 [Cellvibrionaceae bacterium]